MNVYLLSILLGIIEGLTEFLPVSSTAHLRIAEALLNVPLDSGYWKMFSIVIQLGAILTLPIYFRQRIFKFFSTYPSGDNGRSNWLTHPVGLVGAAFVVTAIPAYLLHKVIGKNLESLFVMGTALIVGGIVMWIIDALYSHNFLYPGRRTVAVEKMTLPQAVWIGACQILSAVFPGTSRSMSTIAAGQLAGMTRAAALEFSFFLSIPTMVVATLYDLLRSMHPGHGEAAIGVAPATTEQWIVLAIGFVVSFLVAYRVVSWFMNWVRTRGFVPFAIYRLVVGAAVLIWALNR